MRLFHCSREEERKSDRESFRCVLTRAHLLLLSFLPGFCSTFPFPLLLLSCLSFGLSFLSFLWSFFLVFPFVWSFVPHVFCSFCLSFCSISFFLSPLSLRSVFLSCLSLPSVFLLLRLAFPTYLPSFLPAFSFVWLFFLSFLFLSFPLFSPSFHSSFTSFVPFSSPPFPFFVRPFIPFSLSFVLSFFPFFGPLFHSSFASFVPFFLPAFPFLRPVFSFPLFGPSFQNAGTYTLVMNQIVTRGIRRAVTTSVLI